VCHGVGANYIRSSSIAIWNVDEMNDDADLVRSKVTVDGLPWYAAPPRKAWQRGQVRDHFGVCSIEFSKTGKLLVAAGTISELERRYHLHYLNSVGRASPAAASPLENALPGICCVWDAHSGKLIREINTRTGTWHSCSWFVGARILADERTVITCGNRIEYWDIHGGAATREFKSNDAGYLAMDLSPDEQLLATVTVKGQLTLWSLPTGTEVGNLKAGDSQLSAVVFSHDGCLLAAGGQDGDLHLWNLCSGTLKTPIGPLRVWPARGPDPGK
jgi:hypothetical protein